jgi:hypothetical protein
MAVTHFSGPLQYSGKGTVTGAWGTDLTISANPAVVSYLDDFLGVALDSTNDWTVVKDSGATAGIVADAVNGLLELTSAATTDNDGASVQGNEVYKAAVDKVVWFETRLQCNKVDQTDICVGLTVNFATNPENMLTAADRIVFQVDDGNASILCKTESGGTETSTDSGVDLVNDTDATLGFRVSGTGLVEFFVNRKLVATHTTNIPTTELALAAMSLSGDALGTRSTKVDYLFASATR